MNFPDSLPNLDKLTKKVVSACKIAGRLLMRNIRTASPELKGNNDLVTKADMESERILIDTLSTLYNHATVLGEESGLSGQETDQLWVIDPLDGTINYSFQIPFFAVSVALLYKGQPILGVVHAPTLKETFTSWKGGGAYLNGEKLDLRKSKERHLNIVATSAGMTQSDFKTRTSHYHERLLSHYSRLRLMGSQALHLCFVAAGRLDAALTNEARLWDDAAGSLILIEAGGTYSDFRGRPLLPIPKNSSLFRGVAFESLGTRSTIISQKILHLLND